MARFLRLMLVFVGAWATGAASAAVPLVPYWVVVGTQTPTFPSQEAACASPQMVGPGYTFTNVVSTGTTSAQCHGYANSNPSFIQNLGAIAQMGVGCPANSAPGSSGCDCASGYVEGSGASAGQCVPKPQPNCPSAGLASEDVTWTSSSSEATYNFCENGPGSCGMYARPSICFRTGSGVFECSGTSYFTGSRPASCSGSGSTPEAPAPNKPPPAPCPAGQQPGTVNGITMCAPVGTDKPSEAPAPGNGSSEVKKPDGSAVQTSQSGTTSCSGGTCTTTTTNNTTIINKPGDTSCPAGTTQGTTTKDGQTVTTCSSSSTSTSSQSQTGYCKGSGAGSAQCGGEGSGSSFGGNCAAGFKAVSEDAVLNAMAEEQWRRNCQFFDKKPDDTEESLAYEDMKAKGKAGVDQTASNPGNRTVNFGPGDFDSTSPIGNGACITDKQFSFWGASFTAPFSIICPYIEYIRLLLLASGFILAARIVVAGG